MEGWPNRRNKAACSNLSGVALVWAQFTDVVGCIQFCKTDSSAQAQKILSFPKSITVH